ncbi:MAG: hypothetical protein HY330_03700, partial [Chloroflexi bacterium]|nr:hypothetical protein [Chloroflexota bacterium]
VQSADLRAVTEGSLAAGQVPSRLAFFTLETAAGGLLERWRIASAGDLKAMNGDLDLNSRSLKNAVLGTALNLNGQALSGGGTFSGAMAFSAKPAITASVAAQGFINVPIATAAPSAPANGDMWVEDIAGVRKLAVRIGGVTYSATLA